MRLAWQDVAFPLACKSNINVMLSRYSSHFTPCWAVRPPAMHDPNDKTWGCLLISVVAHRNYWGNIKHEVDPDICFLGSVLLFISLWYRDIIESNTFSPIVLTNSQTDIKNDHGRSMSLPLFMRIAVWWVQLP